MIAREGTPARKEAGESAPSGLAAPAQPDRLPRRHLLILGALLVACTHVYWTQQLDESSGASVKAHGDSIYYYAYLRSLVFDRDVDFKNDYRLLGNPFNLELSERGRPKNPFAIGAAFLWLPFLGGTHTVIAIGRAFDVWHDPLDGASIRYQRMVFYGSLLYGLAAVVLFVLVARRYGDSSSALLTALAMTLATPLCWYMVRQAAFPHAVDTFVVAVLCWYWLRTLYSRRLWQWAVLGALCGLAMLVRTQNLGHAILPVGEAVLLLVGAIRRRDRQALVAILLGGAACAVTAGLVFLPQALAWKAIYGKLLLVPQGHGFMFWGASKWAEALWSSRNGLFAWSPVLQLGLLGLTLMLFWPRAPHARTVAGLALLAIGFQAYVNGCAQDWWAGWAFGGRRFMGCFVYFAIGLASLLAQARPVLARAARSAVAGLPAILIALLVLFNFGLMDDYLEGRIDRGSPQPMGTLWRNSVIGAYDKLYQITGNPGSIPANLIFALRAGVSPARYDRLSGDELGDERIGLDGDRLTLGGFGDPAVYRGRRCRWVEGQRATLALPLRKAWPVNGTVVLQPASPGTRVRLELDGETLLDQVLGEGWQPHRFTVSRRHLRAGINYLRILQELPQPATWEIGRTGQRSRQEIEVESAGFNGGNRAVFFFGRERLTSWRRGVIVYTFDPQGTRYARLTYFDTNRIAEETLRFADAIRRLPQGTGVVLAVKDDASQSWTPEGDEALRSLGGKESLNGRFRQSYALIGVKGAQPGTAMEGVGPRAVTLTLGRRPADRGTGVAWSELSVALPPKPF